MGTAVSTAAPERARWPRLRPLLARGYAGFTEATAPRHLVLPATTSVPPVVKLADAGYADQAHLIRDFHQFTGTTPTQFQARTLPSPGDGEQEVNSVQDTVAAGS
jgi:hypothetical protein